MAKQEQPRSLTPDERKRSNRLATCVIGLAIIVMCGLLALLFAGASGLMFGRELRILATPTKTKSGDQETIVVKGAVLYGNKLWSHVSVSAIATDSSGGAIASDVQTSDERGAFSMRLPATPPPAAVLLKVETWSYFFVPHRASLVIYLDKANHDKDERRVASLHWSSMVVVLCIFAASLLFALASWTDTPETPSLRALQAFAWPRIQYYYSVILACALSIAIVFAFGSIMRDVDSVASSRNELNLGFASLFKGSYVENDPSQQWLFSLTSRALSEGSPTTVQKTVQKTAEDAPGNGHDIGFGAPLWVLFLATIGSMLLTVSLVVEEIAKLPSFEYQEREALARRMRYFVRHGFFVLSSPITGIFVYQMLVASGAAQTVLTVAFAALGTGPLISPLLTRATGQVGKMLKLDDKKATEADGNKSDPKDGKPKTG